MKQVAVRLGQLYRSTEGRLFGRHGPEWRVLSMAVRDDGLTYATLAMTRDPSEHKTLAMGALLDRRKYKLVEDASPDEPSIAPGS